ncbi:MAG: 4-hydroxy-tetrahydrodipicolinate reductase [Flavobacteriaceae bacterium]|nr:4-hydroxy-tetrahydrodipicolinate reductase [Flavobacteriaceae bacterium]
MKIALLGYGKMGKAVEKIAENRGHKVVLRLTKDVKDYNIRDADVAVDFSIPSAAYDNISNCLNNGVPVVSGTTGWLKDYDNITSLCRERDGAFIYASNFSLGVNILFEMNKKLASIMSGQNDYKVRLSEIHHQEKLDAPSGTAITLAEDIIANSQYSSWELNRSTSENSIPIQADRVKDVTGTHIIDYSSEMDSIKIYHEAFNRQGFALGAVIAAEWLRDKSGIFTMKDVLNIG